jgi:hypothetical protein
MARQRLGHPGANAADPDHRHTGTFERRERRRAIQPGDAAKPPRMVRGFKVTGAGSKIGGRGGTGCRHNLGLVGIGQKAGKRRVKKRIKAAGAKAN